MVMTMASKNPQPPGKNLQNGWTRVIRSHREVAETLPKPSDRWTRDDIGISQTMVKRMEPKGIIKCVDKVRNHTGGRKIYRTAQRAYDFIEGLDEPATPCGHTGISNVRGEDRYSCGLDECDVRFSRETAWEEINR